MKYDAISKKLNEAWLDKATEEYREGGFSAALILTDKMIYCDELGRQVDEIDVKPLIGIIEESPLLRPKGFIDYELFPTEKAARDKWEDLTNMWERVYHPEAAYA